MKKILNAIEDQFAEPSSTVLFHARFDTKIPLTQTHLKPTNKDKATVKELMSKSFRETASGLESLPIIIPVWAMCLFFYTEEIYFSEAKKLVSRRTPSLIRLIDIATSSLIKANVIYSPKLIQSHDGSRKLIGQTNYVEVFLMPYDIENNTKKFRGGEFQ